MSKKFSLCKIENGRMNGDGCDGLSDLTEVYGAEFAVPENMYYYSGKDYNAARRKYVKGRLEGIIPRPEF